MNLPNESLIQYAIRTAQAHNSDECLLWPFSRTIICGVECGVIHRASKYKKVATIVFGELVVPVSSGHSVQQFCKNHLCYNLRHLFQSNPRIIHGLTNTVEYKIWKGIKTRCFNPNRKCSKDYIDRGITICDEWTKSFSAFFAEVGPRPSARHSIERIRNDGNYEPGNVKWATKDEQMSNTRRTVRLVYDGRVQTLSQWSRETGVNHRTIGKQIRDGVPIRFILGPMIARNRDLQVIP